MRTIINKHQSVLLELLKETSDMTHAQLQHGANIKHKGTYIDCIQDLKERGLVSSTQQKPGIAMLHNATQMGLQALSDYITHQAISGTVRSGKLSIYEMPLYSTPSATYYRNDGLKHIQSRGV